MENGLERPLNYENGRDIRERTFEFACRVVRFCRKVFEGGGVGRVIVPQLIDSSTSVASMLEEARAAESKRDFISKCSIGLKEARETWLRLRVCVSTQIGDAAESKALSKEADEIVSILTAIVRNTRRRAAIEPRRSPKVRIPNS